MIVAFVFIFGLFVGSFLNVVIFRLHRQESFIRGSSKCLFCGHKLYPQDLVPFFSFLYLRGRCRYCRERFSVQYPLVELATALAFVLIFVRLFGDFSPEFLTPLVILHLFNWWALAAFLVIIFVYDLKYYLILDSVVWPAIILALTANLVLGMLVWSLFTAMLVGGGFFFLQFVISQGRWIGGGDVRLGALMGAILGWPHILTALFIAYILGSVFSIFLLAGRKKGLKDKLPFGTFLALATFLTMLYGQILVDWYWSLFIF
ncbi:MAG: prepilin peptidase [Patescibacteria group bacterium]|nr:prepilin peptidase [Patescibacteria group bacterium]